MFDDIGGKIKMVAKIACWIGIILSVCYGIYDFVHEMPVDGIIWIVVGPLSSWIGTFVLYGFGELIDRVTSIEYKVNQLGETPKQNEGALSKLMRNNSVGKMRKIMVGNVSAAGLILCMLELVRAEEIRMVIWHSNPHPKEP